MRGAGDDREKDMEEGWIWRLRLRNEGEEECWQRKLSVTEVEWKECG
jgi:hypothetical protein